MPYENLLSKISASVSGYFGKSDKKALAFPVVGNNLGVFNSHNNPSEAKGGLRKPTKVSFEQLRMISRADSLTRVCINVIKKAVSQADWRVVPKAGVTPSDKKIRAINELFTLLNSNNESMRVLLDRVLEDLLVLDAGVIEKVYNAKGELVELNSIDGATIRPRFNKYGEMEEDKAYVQVIGGKVVAEFTQNEIIYMMANPQNDINLFGYGMSPIESILMTVQASLNAEVYNAQVFSTDNIPPGLLDLGGMSADEAQQFIALWNATVVNNTHKLKFIWGSENAKKYVPFNNSNKDMQYAEYIDWLSRIKLANYGLTSMDANITQDVNRATSETQEGMSNSRGILSTKKLVEEYFNREILIPAGYADYEFQFERAVSLKDKKMQADIDKVYIDAMVVAPEEISEREGFEPVEEEIEESTPSPNPVDIKEIEDIDSGKKKKDDKKKDDKQKGKGVSKVSKHFKPLYE